MQNTLQVELYCWCIFDTDCLILYKLMSVHSEVDFSVTKSFWKWCNVNLIAIAVLVCKCTEPCVFHPVEGYYYLQLLYIYITEVHGNCVSSVIFLGCRNLYMNTYIQAPGLCQFLCLTSICNNLTS